MSHSPQPAQSKSRQTRRPRGTRHCKIVTFYDRFADAIRSLKHFDSLARDISRDLPVHATSWSFDLLGRRELNPTILRDTSPADVVIVAANGDCGLPDRVASWVENCMNRHPDASPVLVALHDEALEADGAADALCASLKQIANRRHAKFMCNTDLKQCMNQSHEPSIEPGRQTEERPILARKPAQHSHAIGARWWGLNE